MEHMHSREDAFRTTIRVSWASPGGLDRQSWGGTCACHSAGGGGPSMIPCPANPLTANADRTTSSRMAEQELQDKLDANNQDKRKALRKLKSTLVRGWQGWRCRAGSCLGLHRSRQLQFGVICKWGRHGGAVLRVALGGTRHVPAALHALASSVSTAPKRLCAPGPSFFTDYLHPNSQSELESTHQRLAERGSPSEANAAKQVASQDGRPLSKSGLHISAAVLTMAVWWFYSQVG